MPRGDLRNVVSMLIGCNKELTTNSLGQEVEGGSSREREGCREETVDVGDLEVDVQGNG